MSIFSDTKISSETIKVPKLLSDGKNWVSGSVIEPKNPGLRTETPPVDQSDEAEVLSFNSAGRVHTLAPSRSHCLATDCTDDPGNPL